MFAIRLYFSWMAKTLSSSALCHEPHISVFRGCPPCRDFFFKSRDMSHEMLSIFFFFFFSPVKLGTLALKNWFHSLVSYACSWPCSCLPLERGNHEEQSFFSAESCGWVGGGVLFSTVSNFVVHSCLLRLTRKSNR